MYIKPKPVFNTTTALLNRACPDTYPSCDPTGGPGPALIPLANNDAGPATVPVATSASPYSDGDTTTPTTTTLTPIPEAALAADIQHFGKRNFVGLLVLGLLALLGLALWLTFGAWPRRMMRKVRARYSAKRGEGEGESETKGEGNAGAHAEGRRSGQAAHLEADGARAHASRERSEEKIETPTDSNPPSSQPSLELEVEGLGKDSDETKKRTLPRVRFA
ncbi:hypothetical protein C8Q76DRAFT_791794 [Earliella scabrosa]|nr:hypothetical protein C8Q76DRAFT_791794 [Earliella scabrosa]